MSDQLPMTNEQAEQIIALLNDLPREIREAMESGAWAFKQAVSDFASASQSLSSRLREGVMVHGLNR